MVPHNSNVMVNIPLIAGIPLSVYNYKVTRNGKLECLKIYTIGQPAAKTLNYIIVRVRFRDYPKGVVYG